ncbi:MAG: hypothetical protein ACK4ND_00785 [Cytophagaceae bacterium]
MFFDLFRYENRKSVVRNPIRETVFEIKDIEIPAAWSLVAIDILAHKYLRKKSFLKAMVQ